MSGRTAVRLPAAVRRGILAHARRDAPLECCGLLVGHGRTVWFAVPMVNVERSAVRYRIDDRAHIDLRRTLRSAVPPLSILGVYHSHPRGAAVPSPTDDAEAHYPDWVYIIVGFGGGAARTARAATTRAFRLKNGRLVPQMLR